MNVSPSDRWKVALLVLLIVVVAGYGVKTTLDRLEENRAAEAARSNVAPTIGQPGLPATNANVPGGQANTLASNGVPGAPRLPTAADVDEETTPVGPAGRDPFTPAHGQPLPASEQPKQGGTHRSPIGPVVQGPSFPNFWDKNRGSLVPASIPEPEPPAVTLKGVVAGERPMAVVEVAGQVYYKQQGDLLPGGVTVTKITESGIWLKSKRGNRELRVGHTTAGGIFGPAAPSSMPQTRPMGSATAPSRSETAPLSARPIASVSNASQTSTPASSAPSQPTGGQDLGPPSSTASKPNTQQAMAKSQPPATGTTHPQSIRRRYAHKGQPTMRHRVRRRSARLSPSFSGRHL